MLIGILVVPAVKAATVGRAFDWGLGFVKSNFDPNLLWLVGGIGFFGWLSFRKRNGGAVGSTGELRYLGDSGERDRRNWALRKAKDDRRKEANQLNVDKRIDQQISGLRWVETRLDREQINLDKELYSLEDYAKKLLYLEKKIKPYLEKILKEINKIIEQIRKGKLNDQGAAQQNLQKLHDQYMFISQKHYALLEKFRSLIRRERGIIVKKIDEGEQEDDVLKRERADEKFELGNIGRERNEALDELGRLEEARASRKEIKLQHKKIRDITLRRKTERRELGTASREEAITRKAIGLEKSIEYSLGVQEKLIEGMEQIESTIAKLMEGGHVGLVKVNQNKLEKQLRLMERHAAKTNRGIEELRNIDKKNKLLEARAEGLEKKKGRWSRKEADISRKEEISIAA